MLRRVAALVVIAMLASACTSAGEGTTESDASTTTSIVGSTRARLRIAGASDIDSLDPAAMYSNISWFLARGVFRTLTTYADPAAEGPRLVGDLATDTGTSNEDATEWSFTLKENVTFGPSLGGRRVGGVTGRAITCADVKNGIERIFVPSVGAGYPFYYDVIEGAEAFRSGAAAEIAGIECLDDRSVVFHLTEPAADWPLRMAMPATSPIPRSVSRHSDSGPASKYESRVVFTGPYFVAERKAGRSIRLERNPEWDRATDGARRASFDGVDWTLGLTGEEGIKKTLRGDFDLALDLPARGTRLERIVSNPRLLPRLVNETEGCTRYIFLNTEVEPFDDPLVRRAVAFAIDRANLKRIFGGPVTGPVATSVIPPGLTGHLPATEYEPFSSEALAGDLDRAKELMARAGYPDGYSRPVRIVGGASPPLSRIFDSVVADLRRLGFSHLVPLQPPSSEEYSKYYARPSSQTAIGTSGGWCKDYPDPYSFIVPVLTNEGIEATSSRNYANLTDPELEAAVAEAAAETDPQAAADLWEEVNRLATETAAWVPWSWDESSIVLGPRLKNAGYLQFLAQIDWVNASLKRARTS
jgi:peptide/nickel transport system substrate-binding protein